MKNLLIVFEGLDGSGKTTQIKKLRDWFLEEKLEVHVTKQPTDYYRNDKRVRDYLDKGIAPNMYSIALLAAADRTYQTKVEIEPILADSNIISDRYLYSSLAFFKARGLEYSDVLEINRDIPEPDAVIFLDVPPEKALNRVHNRDGKDIKFEEQNDSVFHNVRNNFLSVLPKNSLIVDSTQDVEQVHQEIVAYISKKISEVK